MNLLDAYVTEVQTYPYRRWAVWVVGVEYQCDGRLFTKSLMFNTFEEAMQVKVGWHFLT